MCSELRAESAAQPEMISAVLGSTCSYDSEALLHDKNTICNTVSIDVIDHVPHL